MPTWNKLRRCGNGCPFFPSISLFSETPKSTATTNPTSAIALLSCEIWRNYFWLTKRRIEQWGVGSLEGAYSVSSKKGSRQPWRSWDACQLSVERGMWSSRGLRWQYPIKQYICICIHSTRETAKVNPLRSFHWDSGLKIKLKVTQPPDELWTYSTPLTILHQLF